MAQEPSSALLTPRVLWARREVQPPAHLYLSPETILFTEVRTAFTGATVVTIGRLLRLDGSVIPFRRDLFPPADRSGLSQVSLSNVEGFLLGVVAGTVDIIRTGQGNIRLGIGYGLLGGVDVALLAQGKLIGERPLSYPPGIIEETVAGPGMLRSIAGTDPAAGAEISETVPTNARWRVVAMRFQLVTAVGGVDRRVFIEIDDGATILARFNGDQGQAAATTLSYNATAVGALAATGLTEVALVLPAPLLLFQGWRIRTLTSNLAAGDNFGAPRLLVEEWIEE